jgi:hypothetical protein
MTEGWRRAWTEALDALDADVTSMESLLADDHRLRDVPLTDPWQPPAGLGPLPLDLRPRADGILRRQLAAAEALTRVLATNRQQAAVAGRILSGQGPGAAAYVDCMA